MLFRSVVAGAVGDDGVVGQRLAEVAHDLPEPVYAEVRGDAPAAFVRVMLLPVAIQGAPSIRYVRDEDRDRPKSQSYTVFVDEPLP